MTGIILAGGKSWRMGKNKALLQVDDRRIIEIIMEKLGAVFDNILIVSSSPLVHRFFGANPIRSSPCQIANTPQGLLSNRVKIVRDAVHQRGPLGGIYTGLLVSESEYNFICGCDMPFLNPNLLRFMASEVNDSDIIVPIIGGFVEPLHSIYSKRCLSVIKSHLEIGDLRIKNFFPEVKDKYLPEDLIRRYDPDLLSFLNLNTPKELQLVRKLK